MLSVLGAILVLFAGTMSGFYISRQYANRPKHIRQLLHSLQRLETEIAYGLTPLPDALERISRQVNDPLDVLFRHAAEQMGAAQQTTDEAWSSAVEVCWRRTAMKSPEKEVLLQLGRSLGNSDSNDQVKHLKLAMSQLRSEEDTASEEQHRYEKMWRSLGVLGGALVVIIMF